MRARGGAAVTPSPQSAARTLTHASARREAGKYTQNTRIMRVQAEMAERCLELVRLPAGESCLLLDIGCGSGLSGEVLSEAGHMWVGLDISESMLEVAVGNEVEGDVLLADMGQGFGFRAGMFDGAIRCVSRDCLDFLALRHATGHPAPPRHATPPPRPVQRVGAAVAVLLR